MKIGCGTVLFRRFNLEQGLDAIRSIGYEYFETQAVGPWCPHIDIERDDPEKLVRLKEKYGFKQITGLWSLNGNIISNPLSVESGIRTVEWAAAAGIPIVHTGDGHKPEGMSDEYAYNLLEERLSAILEVARKNNVTVAIEPHGAFSLTGKGLQKIMTFGNSDVLGINYDACNVFRATYVESGNNKSGWEASGTGENELDVLKTISHRVVHCHVKDINAEKKCVAVGSGIVNIRDCVRYLKQIGYSGVISVETEGSDNFDEIVKLATVSYQYLNSIVRGE